MPGLATLPLYLAAALAEIGGCFAVWAWLRLGRSAIWLLPGGASLLLFAWLLTLSPAAFAGRAYAAYGGVYISVALMWLWAVDAVRPSITDWLGVGLGLLGMSVIILGARQA